MRDYRDAKAMAQTLRESLSEKSITVSHSESLELVSRILGIADWNTLSALIKPQAMGSVTTSGKSPGVVTEYPAVPLRDFVPFPGTQVPLYVGRRKTVQALEQAFMGRREVVLAIQRDTNVDEPGFADIYPGGAVASLLELEWMPDNTIRVMARVDRRATIRRFTNDAGAFQASIVEADEHTSTDARALIGRALDRFKDYREKRGLQAAATVPALDPIQQPGALADQLTAQMLLPLSEKQKLLAMHDPAVRLDRVIALMGEVANGPPASADLTTTLSRAHGLADQRQHGYATLEHLLLAIVDETQSADLLRQCGVDLEVLRQSLRDYVENGLVHLVTEQATKSRPTSAVSRVRQRAELQAWELHHKATTSLDLLLALFDERNSPAAQSLMKQHISKRDVLNRLTERA